MKQPSKNENNIDNKFKVDNAQAGSASKLFFLDRIVNTRIRDFRNSFLKLADIDDLWRRRRFYRRDRSDSRVVMTGAWRGSSQGTACQLNCDHCISVAEPVF